MNEENRMENINSTIQAFKDEISELSVDLFDALGDLDKEYDEAQRRAEAGSNYQEPANFDKFKKKYRQEFFEEQYRTDKEEMYANLFDAADARDRKEACNRAAVGAVQNFLEENKREVERMRSFLDRINAELEDLQLNLEISKEDFKAMVHDDSLSREEKDRIVAGLRGINQGTKDRIAELLAYKSNIEGFLGYYDQLAGLDMENLDSVSDTLIDASEGLNQIELPGNERSMFGRNDGAQNIEPEIEEPIQTIEQNGNGNNGSDNTSNGDSNPDVSQEEEIERWAPGYTEEQILDAIERGIDEPKGIEYEQWLNEVVPLGDVNQPGIPVKKSNGVSEEDEYETIRWAPGYTEEQILDAIERGIDEPKGIEYEQWLNEVVPLGNVNEPGVIYKKVKKEKPVPPKKEEPIPPKKDEPIPPKKEEPIPKKKNVVIGIDEEAFEAARQDMLDKYYGHSGKKKEYKERMKRFKSHVVDNEGIKTVEDYPERVEDEKFLQLEEYATRIERYSRAEQGDLSQYSSLYEACQIAGVLPTDSNGVELDLEQTIALFRMQDEDYIKTNNNAYNQHASTQENLKTLGKYGQKLPFIPIDQVKKTRINEDGEEEEYFDGKAALANVGRGLGNAFIAVRNVRAAAHRLIGTYIAAPIHKLMFDSDKVTSGMYKNMSSHRYNARKDYFEQQMLADYVAKHTDERTGEVRKPGLGFAFASAFKPRFQAVFKAKKGNEMVLSAGANDLLEYFQSEAIERVGRIRRDAALSQAKAQITQELAKTREQLKTCDDKKERLKLCCDIMTLGNQIEQIDRIIVANASMPVRGVPQTDAISLSVHDKANKENMTIAVTAVKTAIRAGATHYIAKNLTKHVEEVSHIEKDPDTVVTDKEWVDVVTTEQMPSGYKMENIEDLKFSDLMQSADKDLQHHAWGNGGRVIDKTDSVQYIRGVAFKYKGKSYSGSDGIGFDIAGRTQVQVDIGPDSNVVDVMYEVAKKSGCTDTREEFIQYIQTPEGYSELVGQNANGIFNFNTWVSRCAEKVPTGWSQPVDKIPQLEETFTEVETINRVLQETERTIPGAERVVVDIAAHDEIRPGMVAAGGAMAAGAAGDAYEVLRRTQSAEELEARGAKKVVHSHQKNNKGMYSERDTTNRYGFDGTREGDYDSSYDETSIELGTMSEWEIQALIDEGVLPENYGQDQDGGRTR